MQIELYNRKVIVANEDYAAVLFEDQDENLYVSIPETVSSAVQECPISNFLIKATGEALRMEGYKVPDEALTDFLTGSAKGVEFILLPLQAIQPSPTNETIH